MTEELIFSKIIIVRNQKVILDAELAKLYGVETRRLKESVNRNKQRFPKDFLIELTLAEYKAMKGNTSVASSRGKHSKYLPYAFTEQGIAMLSSVLKSKQAIAVNIRIMRVFVKMRQMIFSYKELLEKIEKLEANDANQSEHIRNIYALIKELLEPQIKNREQIGFKISSK